MIKPAHVDLVIRTALAPGVPDLPALLLALVTIEPLAKGEARTLLGYFATQTEISNAATALLASRRVVSLAQRDKRKPPLLTRA